MQSRKACDLLRFSAFECIAKLQQIEAFLQANLPTQCQHRWQSTELVPKRSSEILVQSSSSKRSRPTRNTTQDEKQTPKSQTNLRLLFMKQRADTQSDEDIDLMYNAVFGEAEYLKSQGLLNDNAGKQQNIEAEQPQFTDPDSTYIKFKRIRYQKLLSRHIFPETFKLYRPKMIPLPEPPDKFCAKELIAKYRLKDHTSISLTPDDTLYLLYLADPVMLKPDASELDQSSLLTLQVGQSFFEAMVGTNPQNSSQLNPSQNPTYDGHMVYDSQASGINEVEAAIAQTLAMQSNFSRYLQRQHKRALAYKHISQQNVSVDELYPESDTTQTYAIGLSKAILETQLDEPQEDWFKKIESSTKGDQRLREALELDDKLTNQRQKALQALEERRKRQASRFNTQRQTEDDGGQLDTIESMDDIDRPSDFASTTVTGSRYGLARSIDVEPSNQNLANDESTHHARQEVSQEVHTDGWELKNLKYEQRLKDSFFAPPKEDSDKLVQGSDMLDTNGSQKTALPDMKQVQQVQNTPEGGYTSDLLDGVLLYNNYKKGPTFEKDDRGVIHVKRQNERKEPQRGAALAAPRRKGGVVLDTSLLMDRWYGKNTEGKQAQIMDNKRFVEQMLDKKDAKD